MAFALYGLAVVFAPAIGPTLGGWITDNYNWRWIFFINVPIAILSLFLTNRLVEDPPHIQREVAKSAREGLKLDYFGFGLLASGFGYAGVHPRQGAGGRLVRLAYHRVLPDGRIGLVLGVVWEM